MIYEKRAWTGRLTHLVEYAGISPEYSFTGTPDFSTFLLETHCTVVI